MQSSTTVHFDEELKAFNDAIRSDNVSVLFTIQDLDDEIRALEGALPTYRTLDSTMQEINQKRTSSPQYLDETKKLEEKMGQLLKVLLPPSADGKNENDPNSKIKQKLEELSQAEKELKDTLTQYDKALDDLYFDKDTHKDPEEYVANVFHLLSTNETLYKEILGSDFPSLSIKLNKIRDSAGSSIKATFKRTFTPASGEDVNLILDQVRGRKEKDEKEQQTSILSKFTGTKPKQPQPSILSIYKPEKGYRKVKSDFSAKEPERLKYKSNFEDFKVISKKYREAINKDINLWRSQQLQLQEKKSAFYAHLDQLVAVPTVLPHDHTIYQQRLNAMEEKLLTLKKRKEKLLSINQLILDVDKIIAEFKQRVDPAVSINQSSDEKDDKDNEADLNSKKNQLRLLVEYIQCIRSAKQQIPILKEQLKQFDNDPFLMQEFSKATQDLDQFEKAIVSKNTSHKKLLSNLQKTIVTKQLRLAKKQLQQISNWVRENTPLEDISPIVTNSFNESTDFDLLERENQENYAKIEALKNTITIHKNALIKIGESLAVINVSAYLKWTTLNIPAAVAEYTSIQEEMSEIERQCQDMGERLSKEKEIIQAGKQYKQNFLTADQKTDELLDALAAVSSPLKQALNFNLKAEWFTYSKEHEELEAKKVKLVELSDRYQAIRGQFFQFEDDDENDEVDDKIDEQIQRFGHALVSQDALIKITSKLDDLREKLKERINNNQKQQAQLKQKQEHNLIYERNGLLAECHEFKTKLLAQKTPDFYFPNVFDVKDPHALAQQQEKIKKEREDNTRDFAVDSRMAQRLGKSSLGVIGIETDLSTVESKADEFKLDKSFLEIASLRTTLEETQKLYNTKKAEWAEFNNKIIKPPGETKAGDFKFDLRGRNFRNFQLKYFTISGSLYGTDLSGANLSEANFDLKTTNFKGVIIDQNTKIKWDAALKDGQTTGEKILVDNLSDPYFATFKHAEDKKSPFFANTEKNQPPYFRPSYLINLINNVPQVDHEPFTAGLVLNILSNISASPRPPNTTPEEHLAAQKEHAKFIVQHLVPRITSLKEMNKFYALIQTKNNHSSPYALIFKRQKYRFLGLYKYSDTNTSNFILNTIQEHALRLYYSKHTKIETFSSNTQKTNLNALLNHHRGDRALFQYEEAKLEDGKNSNPNLTILKNKLKDQSVSSPNGPGALSFFNAKRGEYYYHQLFANAIILLNDPDVSRRDIRNIKANIYDLDYQFNWMKREEHQNFETEIKKLGCTLPASRDSKLLLDICDLIVEYREIKKEEMQHIADLKKSGIITSGDLTVLPTQIWNHTNGAKKGGKSKESTAETFTVTLNKKIEIREKIYEKYQALTKQYKKLPVLDLDHVLNAHGRYDKPRLKR